MSIDEVKDYLRQYKRLKQKIALLEDEIKEMDEMSIGGYKTTERVQESPKTVDTIGNIIAKRDKERERLFNAINECLTKREEIKKRLDELEDSTYREVLIRRYIAGERFEEIADKMNYSYRWIRTLHKQALYEFKKIMENTSS